MKTEFIIETSLLQTISSEQAYHYNIIPVEVLNGTLTFKSDNSSEDLKQELQIVLGKHIELIPETSENKTIAKLPIYITAAIFLKNYYLPQKK